MEPQEKGRPCVLPSSQAHPARLADTGLCPVVLLLAAEATLSVALGWTHVPTGWGAAAGAPGGPVPCWSLCDGSRRVPHALILLLSQPLSCQLPAKRYEMTRQR